MKERFVVRVLVAVGLLAGAGAMSSSPAHACGDVWVPEIDHRIMGVARAEEALRKGKYADAAGSISRMFPDIRTLQANKDGLLSRAMRTLALAMVRTEGALTLEYGFTGKTAKARTENLRWAATMYRKLNDIRKNDPSVQTELGEALSKLDEGHDEALALLGGLAERDLVASPEGYAALAKLRAKAGDKAGSETAAKRCEQMASKAEICRVAGGGEVQG